MWASADAVKRSDRLRRPRTPPGPSAVLVAPFLLLLGGCDSDPASGASTVVRDSAGVVIVENDVTRPLLEDGALRVSEAPVVRIGSVEAQGAEQLYGVRHSTFLPGGEIAVVDGESAEVRIFGPEGRPRRTLGGHGEGPGEFRSPWQVYPMAGDSLMVIDLYRATSVFDPEGRYVRRFVPGGVSGESQGPPLGMFDDGSLLFMKYQRSDPSRTDVRRTQVELVRYDTEGELIRSFGLFDHQTSRSGGGSLYVFGPRAHMVPGGSAFLYAPGDRFEVRRIDMTGRTTRLVRLDVEPEAITQTHRDAWMDMLVRGNPAATEERLRQAMGELESPPRFPYHGELAVDDRGHLWVGEYAVRGGRAPTRWFVFDEEGRYLGPVTTPAGFALHEVRGERLLGGWTDEVGVEYVSVYRIEGRSP